MMKLIIRFKQAVIISCLVFVLNASGILFQWAIETLKKYQKHL